MPTGYHVIDRYNPRDKLVILNMAGLAIWIIFGLILLIITSYARPTFNFFSLLQEISNSNLNLMKFGIFLIVIFAATAILHEVIHYIFLLILTHKYPRFRFDVRNFIPYVTPALGVYSPRSVTLVCLLAPLLIFTIMGFPFLFFADTKVIVPALLFVIATHAAISVSDIGQSIWLCSYRENLLWGFDGHSSVLIGRDKKSPEK